jgi:hypothetical protein
MIIVPHEPFEGVGEEEYERWYREEHLSDFVNQGSVLSGRHARIVKGATERSGYPVPEPGTPYVTIYELETDDIEATLKSFAEAPKAAPGRGYINPGTMRVGWYEVLAEYPEP